MEEKQSCCGQTTQETQQIQIPVSEVEWYSNKEENAANRFNVCQECDQLVPVVSICKQCGCFMKIKTRIYDSSCPLQKW